ncbi:hypothetical protein BT69DRAFT_688160 [Atractiella rhizophila]|nr:hypothetical protein BT69DRAFT_688160 [Atractiella rhizophila]
MGNNKYPLPPPDQPPPSRDELPKAIFTVVVDGGGRFATSDRSLNSYGYRGTGDWKRPAGEAYMQYKPPTEQELMKQVEYDMDEQDGAWLDLMNKQRKSAPVISPEFFEIAMDRLEKEWFKLMELVPKKQVHLTEADSKCAICDDGDAENSNAIVFCDGCNIAVHQDCYGIPYVPEGQWLCRKCDLSPEAPVSCDLCPNTWGAYKQTTTGSWVHLICALWIPETTVQNVIYMEPVENVEKIDKARKNLQCVICGGKKEKPCIQCSVNSCRVAFHVTCARARGLYMKLGMKVSREEGQKDGELEWERMIAYCEKHSPNGHAVPPLPPGQHFLPSSQQQRFNEMSGDSKAARAYGEAPAPSSEPKHHPFNVPKYIFDKVFDYLKHFKMGAKERKNMLQLVCKYWGLKRESRRGAVLLKRLHLEPWGSRNFEADDKEIAMKRKELEKLRGNIESFRANILTKVLDRDGLKQQEAEVLKNFTDSLLFAKHHAMYKGIVDALKKNDSSRYFHQPVNKELYPNYRDIIKRPMDFATILDKISRREYMTVDDFKADIFLIYSNAQTFNHSDNACYHAAQRGRAKAIELLGQQERNIVSAQFDEEYLNKVLTVPFVKELFAPGLSPAAPIDTLLPDVATFIGSAEKPLEGDTAPSEVDETFAKKGKKGSKVKGKRMRDKEDDGAPPAKKRRTEQTEPQALGETQTQSSS